MLAFRGRLVGDRVRASGAGAFIDLGARLPRAFGLRAWPLRVGGVGTATGRGGGVVLFRRPARASVVEEAVDADDEADEPRLGPADTDASSSALDSDEPEESERAIARVSPGVESVYVAEGYRLA